MSISIANASVETRKRGNGFTVVIVFSNKTLEHVHSAKEHRCLTEEAACSLANRVFEAGKVNPDLWVIVKHEIAFKPKKFTVKRGKWQTPYRALFNSVKGTCNIQFGNSPIKLPVETRIPESGDTLFGNYAISVYAYGMDVYLKDSGEIISPAIGIEDRTLMDCWRIALGDHYMTNDKHHEKLHSSWYEWVETY